MLPSGMKKNAGSSSRRPPARLSWPASLGEKGNTATNPGPHHPRRKRARRDGRGHSDVDLWVEKFSPTSSVDLCVAPKKVKECSAWMQEATHRERVPAVVPKKLLVLVGGCGVGKSTMVRVLAKELGLELHSWNDSFVSRERGRADFESVMEVERTSALDSFEGFLRQCGAGFSSLQLTSANGDKGSDKRSIILLEDLPNLHGHEAILRFRQIMSDHLNGTTVPTILVFSDAAEGRHNPADLERLIEPNDLYSQSSLVCQIHQVTKPKMKKILDKIAKHQHLQISSDFVEELHLQSGGDVRHAIMTLQFQSAGLISSALSVSSTRHNDRDKKLSTFHALGKLLYAKRKIDENGKERLAFDPEEILARSDLGVGGSLRFLEYHSPDFFTSIEDLSNAYSLFSDATTLLDSPDYGHTQMANYRESSAASVAGRAVAHTNKHATPNKFRQFSTPKVFDVLRKRRQNDILVADLARRLSSAYLVPSTIVGGSFAFVTELLPAMRLILPNVVNPSVDNLYSIAGNTTVGQAALPDPSEEAQALKVQTEILQADDIEDFEDSDDEVTPISATPLARHKVSDSNCRSIPSNKGDSESCNSLGHADEVIIIDD